MTVRKISISILVVAVTAGILGGVWFVLSDGKLLSVPSVSSEDTAQADNPPAPPSDPNKYDYFEISAAKQMVIYDQQAVELANIMQHGEVSSSIREVADEVIATHGKSAERYAQWLNEWGESYFNLSDFQRYDGHDAYPTMPGMPKVVELDTLVAMSTTEKEAEFLRLLLQLHEGALGHINMVSRTIQYKEMKDCIANDKAHYERKIQSIKDLQKTKGFN